MKKTAIISLLMLVAFLGCTQLNPVQVTIPNRDIDNPNLGVLLNSENRGLVGVDMDAGVFVHNVFQGEEVSVLSSAIDQGGVKLLKIEIISGGRLTLNDPRITGTVQEWSGEPSSPKNRIYGFTDKIRYDSPNTNVVIKVTGIDYHDNTTISPTITIVQNPRPIANISADKVSIIDGQTTTLRWTTQNAIEAKIGNNYNASLPSGSLDISPTHDTTYSLKAYGIIGWNLDSVTVEVLPPPRQPHVDLTVSRSTITEGESVRISWTSSNADHINLSPGNESLTVPSGAKTVILNETTSYTATATSSIGTDVDSVTIEVEPKTYTWHLTLPYEVWFDGYYLEYALAIPASKKITQVCNPEMKDISLEHNDKNANFIASNRIQSGKCSHAFDGMELEGQWLAKVWYPANEVYNQVGLLIETD